MMCPVGQVQISTSVHFSNNESLHVVAFKVLIVTSTGKKYIRCAGCKHKKIV